MRFSSSLLLSAMLLGGCASAPLLTPELGLTLSLIHINDTHSQFDASPASVKNANGEPLYTYIGGHPRLLTKAQQLRTQAADEGIPTLFLHGGDAFKGSAYFELFEQRINIDVLNRMGINAMALGNHEFDIGLTKLADFVDKVNFPILAANIDTAAEPMLANSVNLKPFSLFMLDNNQFKPVTSVVAAAGREVVAVFGLALEDMRAIAPDTGAIVFHNEIQSAQQTVDALKAQGVKYIIALTHLGHQRDLALAGAVNGIDAIVGGHSHSLLGDFRHWYLGEQRPYAELVTNPDGKNHTCVVQAGQFAQAVGQARLEFNPAGQLINCGGQNTLLASTDYFNSALRDKASRISSDKQAQTVRYIASQPRTAIVQEDPTLRTLLDTHYTPVVQQAYGAVINSTAVDIPHVRLPGSAGSDSHGSALAGHIADAMLAYVNQHSVQSLIERPVQLALIGAGNIRAPLLAGEVREGNIRLEVLPFDSPLSVLSISGADIRALLTDIISQSVVPGAHTGKFPYVAGIRYVAKQTGPDAVELSTLEIKHDGVWQAVNLGQRYTLVTTSYLADGNDGWQLLQQIQANHSDRHDIILREQQPQLYPVRRVEALQDSSTVQAFKVQYLDSDGLPCKTAGVDCKVAAQAFIDFLKANPALFEQQREPTVTLLR